jgi:hypothetical protein
LADRTTEVEPTVSEPGDALAFAKTGCLTAIANGRHPHLTMVERRRTVMIRRVASQQIIGAPPERRRLSIGV